MLRCKLNTANDQLPMVPNYRLLMLGQRVYLGLSKDSSMGPNGGYRAVDDVIEIKADDPYFVEYILHLRQGDLLALDEATAKKVGGGCKVYAPTPPVDPDTDA